jgi:hypothetical protein
MKDNDTDQRPNPDKRVTFQCPLEEYTSLVKT